MAMVLCKHGNGKGACGLCKAERHAGRFIYNDPGETEGRALYRGRAEWQARADLNMAARQPRLRKEP